MEELVIIDFPLGGGGNWILYTLQRLATKKQYSQTNNVFHNRNAETNIGRFKFLTVHSTYEGYDEHYEIYLIHPSTEFAKIHHIYFGTDKLFQLYLNMIDKLFFNFSYGETGETYAEAFRKAYNIPLEYDGSKEEHQIEMFNSISLVISGLFERIPEHNIQADLHYGDVFNNQKKFIKNFKRIFSQINMSVEYDEEIIKQCIEEYKKSCTDVLSVFSDYDNVFWLAWCYVIIDKLDIIIETDLTKVKSIEKIKQEIVRHSKQIEEYTKEYHMVVNSE